MYRLVRVPVEQTMGVKIYTRAQIEGIPKQKVQIQMFIWKYREDYENLFVRKDSNSGLKKWILQHDTAPAYNALSVHEGFCLRN